jgi:hypothetical protein
MSSCNAFESFERSFPDKQTKTSLVSLRSKHLYQFPYQILDNSRSYVRSQRRYSFSFLSFLESTPYLKNVPRNQQCFKDGTNISFNMDQLPLLLIDFVLVVILLILSRNFFIRYKREKSSGAFELFLYTFFLLLGRFGWIALNEFIKTPLPWVANLIYLSAYMAIGFSILFVAQYGIKYRKWVFSVFVSLSVVAFLLFPAEYRMLPNGYYEYFVSKSSSCVLIIPLILGFLPPAYLLLHSIRARRLKLKKEAFKSLLISLGFILTYLGYIVLWHVAQVFQIPSALGMNKSLLAAGVILVYAGFSLEAEI